MTRLRFVFLPPPFDRVARVSSSFKTVSHVCVPSGLRRPRLSLVAFIVFFSPISCPLVPFVYRQLKRFFCSFLLFNMLLIPFSFVFMSQVT